MILVALFFISRSVLKKSSARVSHYERLQEMYKTVYEFEQAGLSDTEIIVKIKEKYHLNDKEAQYLLDKSRK